MEGVVELNNQEEKTVKPSENGIDNDEKSTENDDEEQTTTTSRVPYNLTIEENDIDSETVVKMKGDAIGDTLYSERFLLKTLLELTSQNGKKLEESFEKDLCFLWDMTIEKSVVKLLLEHSVLELFSGIIDITEDDRLIEILLGIIGNMCCMLETRDVLCNSPEVMTVILNQLISSDPLILLQLMRLLYSAILFENSGDELTWFDHFKNCENFVEKFAFILANSTSSTLLTCSFEALNAICAKFAVIELQPEAPRDTGFSKIFVQKCLIEGLIEAFKQVIPINIESDSSSTDLIPTNSIQKFMNLFLELNLILSQYEELSVNAYKDGLDEFNKCLSRILTPLTQKMYLFPLTSTHQGVIENINDIVQALGDGFNAECFSQMVLIWELIEDEKSKEKPSEWEDDSDDGTAVDLVDICMTILEYCTRISYNCSEIEFINSVKVLNPKIVKTLYTRLFDNDSSESVEIQSIVEKLKQSLKSNWDIIV
ncbi:unnamed protein product [Diamesa hyperborea]